MPIVLLPDPDFDTWSLDLPIDELLPELSASDEAYAAGGFGGVPASGQAVAGLKRQKHGDHAVSRQTKRPRRRRRGTGTGHESTTDKEAAAAAAECAICLEDFEAGDGLAVMPCAHRFHEGCLTEWLALSRLCPCCRHALPSDDEVVDEAPSAATSTATTETTRVAEGGGARRRQRRRHKPRRRRSRRACRPNVRLLGCRYQ